MHDDGVRLVALDHADVEEAGVFAVHDVVYDAALAVAVVLRRLDHGDLGIGEGGGELLEPIRAHHVVGVDHADDLGVGRRIGKREPQRAGLVAIHIVGVDELEALTERAAMLFDRLPEGRIRRVVDHHDAFEVRVVEPRDRIQRLFEHLRRLAIGRDVDRYFRGEAFQCRNKRRRE